MIHTAPTSLASHFEPKTLTELGIVGRQLIFSSSYQPTDLPKVGKQRLIASLPLLGNKNPTQAMDIDLSCTLYGQDKAVIEHIWYGKLRSQNGAIRHQGDSFRGIHKAHHPNLIEECITIRLMDIPSNVHGLSLYVKSYHKQPLPFAVAGSIWLGDNENNSVHEALFSSFDKNATAVLAWQLERRANDWQVYAPMTAV